MHGPRRSGHGFDAKHDMPTHGLGEAFHGAHGWRAFAAFQAIFAVLTEAAWQRCYVHFLRNAVDYLPRKADDDCLQELR